MHRRSTKSSRPSHRQSPIKCAALLNANDGHATTPQYAVDANVPLRSELSLFLEHTQRQSKLLDNDDDDDNTCNNSHSDALSTSAQPGIDLLHDQDESRSADRFGTRPVEPALPFHFHKPHALQAVCTHSTDTTESCTSSNTPVMYYDETVRIPANYPQQQQHNPHGGGVDAEDIYHHFMMTQPPPPPPPLPPPGRRRPRQQQQVPLTLNQEEIYQGNTHYNHLGNPIHDQHYNDQQSSPIHEGEEPYPSHGYESSSDEEEGVSNYSGSPISSYVPNSYHGYDAAADPYRYQPGPLSNFSSEGGATSRIPHQDEDEYDYEDSESCGPQQQYTSVNDLPYLREEEYEELQAPSLNGSCGSISSQHNNNTLPYDNEETSDLPYQQKVTSPSIHSSHDGNSSYRDGDECESHDGVPEISGWDVLNTDGNAESGCEGTTCSQDVDNDSYGDSAHNDDAPLKSTLEEEDDCGSQITVQEAHRTGLDEADENDAFLDEADENDAFCDRQFYDERSKDDEPVNYTDDQDVCTDENDTVESRLPVVPQDECQQQPIAEEEEVELPSTTDSSPCEWWDQLEEQIQAKMPSPLVVSSAMDGEHGMTMEKFRRLLQARVATEDPTQQAIAVALYHGLSMQQQWHENKMRELQEQHERQLAMLSTNSSRDSSQTTSGPSASSPSRTEALRRRWRRKTGATGGLGAAGSRSVDLLRGAVVDEDDDQDHDTRTVATALSTRSCRELSMARYRARIIQEMKRFEPDPRNQEAGHCTNNHSGSSSLKQRGSDVDNDEVGESSGQQSEEIERLLDELQQAERRQKKLEQQLKQAGVVLAEDIPYQEAKDQVARISKRMNEIGNSEAQHEDPVIQKSLREEYYRLEKEMEKYMTALCLTDEFMEEQQASEDAWEAAHLQDNQEALEKMRRHMPVDIRKMTRQQLEEEASVPAAMAKKFQRSNVLQLLRRDPQAIARWHPSNLEALRLSGLTLTERRALHQHLLPAAKIWMDKQRSSSSDQFNQRKLTWFNTMRSNFKEALARYLRHVEESDGVTKAHHRCHLIGKQCPVRADHAMDYSGDLGFPTDDVYEESCVVTAADVSCSPERTSGSAVASSSQQACSSDEKDSAQHAALSKERLSGLREHYKEHPNKVLQVSQALGVCESMDSFMDRMDGQLENWILQQLEQSPQQPQMDKSVDDALLLLGDFRREASSWLARDSNSFSSVEIGLSEEVYETAREYASGVKENLLQENHSEGHRLKLSLKQFEKESENLHARNIRLSSHCTLPPKTRKRKSRTEIMAELWKRDSDCAIPTSDDNSGKCPFNSQPLKPQRPRPEGDSAACSKPIATSSTPPRPGKGLVAPNALLAAISSRRAD